MTPRRSDRDKVRSLIALRVSDDLTAEETRRVDELVRYSSEGEADLDAYTQVLSVLRDAGAAKTAVDDRPSLWSRIEPRLGPAGRYRRRRLDFISTRQLAVAAALLFGLAIYSEVASPQRFVVPIFDPDGANQNVEFLHDPRAAKARPLEAQPDVIPGRPVLGLIVQDVDAAVRKQLDQPQLSGAVVVGVLEGMPAEKAAVRMGDVVVGVNGQNVQSAADLIRALEKVGEAPVIRIDVRRGGKLQQIEVRRPSARSDAGAAASRVYALLSAFASGRSV